MREALELAERPESLNIERLATAADGISQDPLSFIGRVCAVYGLDYAVYATILSNGTIVGYTNYPEDWVRYYTENRLHEIDPVIRAASRSIIPVDWREMEPNYQDSRVFRLARQHGIGALGLSVPVRGPYGDFAVFSVTKDCSAAEWRKLRRSIMRDLQSIAFFFHDAIMRQHGMFKLLNKKALSPREREVLQWYSRGKTQSDIGVLTGLSTSTVTAYLQSARTKLNALTTAHAAARAQRMGEIQTD